MQALPEFEHARDQLEQTVQELTLELSQLHQVLKTEGEARVRAEEQFRSKSPLIEMSADAMIICDLEGRVIFWNQGATRLYGWAADAVIGKTLGDFIYPKEPARFSVNVSAILANQGYRAEERHPNSASQFVVV